MRVVIIGAGIVGVMTAYYLTEIGMHVTLIDRNEKAGTEASRANASLLCYGQKSPLGHPALWKHIPAILTGRDPRIKIRSPFHLPLYSWLFKLLQNCSTTRYRLNHLHLTELAETSRVLMKDILERQELSFDHLKSGRLNLYADKKSLDTDMEKVQLCGNRFGIHADMLTPEECASKLPSLKDRKTPLVGGIFTAIDEIGDCEKFIDEIFAKYLTPKQNFAFMPNTRAEQLIRQEDKIEGVMTDKDVLTADHYILCNGAGARPLLRAHNIYLPIYPIKGYHIRCEMPEGLQVPIPVMDVKTRTVAVQLGNTLKLSTGFIFDGMRTDIPKKYLVDLKNTAQENLFPGYQFGKFSVHSGFRPFTPDSLPIVKPSQKFRNLSYNLGHGMLGWTIAPATAYKCAEQICAIYDLK
ncbi:MAG: FAD-dependent oxidoreductase [Micavibrio sp.]|nr:MAG: FAD-dependent oxidoreductase [Micavibrio sp.]